MFRVEADVSVNVLETRIDILVYTLVKAMGHAPIYEKNH